MSVRLAEDFDDVLWGDYRELRQVVRVDLRAILADPVRRRELMVGVIIATQAREGIVTTVEQAQRAYDKVRAER